MDSLYLLLPMSVLLVLALIGVFAWALDAGQFDDLEREGARLMEDDAVTGTPRIEASGADNPAPLDIRQGRADTPSNNRRLDSTERGIRR